MPTVVLAAPLARWIAVGVHGERSFVVPGATVREAVEVLLTQLPQLRSYLLDDQGALRHHIDRIAAAGPGALVEMASRLAVMGTRLMDLYTGRLSPRALSRP